jgi:hypothetical protein
MRRVGFASALGPLSLLLLPKCPLCLLPLLAVIGVALPPSTALWIAAALIVAVWLAILFLTSHRILAPSLAAAVAIVVIAMQSRPLLWIAILGMTACGIAVMRSCAHGKRLTAR